MKRTNLRKEGTQIVAYATLVLVAVILFLRHKEDFQKKVPGDFQVYQKAAARAQAQENPYNPNDGSPYKYSPGALVPFTLLSKDSNQAWTLFKFLSLMLLPFSILLGASLKKWRDLCLVLLGLILAWKGLIETLDYGQLEFLVLFAAVLAARLYEKYPTRAGILLGILPWFKLPWGFLVIPFLLVSLRAGAKKSKALVIGLTGGFVSVGFILPAVVFGPQKTYEWMRAWLDLLAHQPRDLYWVDVNQSLWSSGARWVVASPVLGAAATFFAALAVLFAFCKLTLRALREPIFKTPLAALATMTPWLVLMQLLNPLSWRWGSMLLVGIPFAVENRPRGSHEKFKVLLGGVIILFLLQLNPVVKMLGMGHWTDLHPWGLITVYWLLLLGLCI